MTPKGIKLSKEQKRNISISIQRKYDTDPDYKKRHAEACRTKKCSQKISFSLKKHYSDPINLQKLRAKFTPEFRKKMSNIQKKRMEDPIERQKNIEPLMNWLNNLTPKELGDFKAKRTEALRKKGAWNKGLTKETDTRVKKVALAKVGKKRSKKTILKISEAKKKMWVNATPEQRDEWNHKNSETHKERLRDPIFREEHIKRLLKWVKTDEHREKVSQNSKKMWKNMTPDKREARRRKAIETYRNTPIKKREERFRKMREKFQAKPNGPERFLIPILEPFGFRYSGNGGFFVSTKNRTCIPDFVNENEKLIVEFDGVYWHTLTKDMERNKIYNTKGYRILSFNEKDILLGKKHVCRLISKFVELATK